MDRFVTFSEQTGHRTSHCRFTGLSARGLSDILNAIEVYSPCAHDVSLVSGWGWEFSRLTCVDLRKYELIESRYRDGKLRIFLTDRGKIALAILRGKARCRLATNTKTN